VKTNHLPPTVIIEDLLVDGHRVPSDGLPLRIDSGRHRFEFRYTGLSFVVPEKVLFKYRLEDLESEWVPAETNRSVIYSHLPPGDFTFQVTACNNDGIWNEAGARMRFSVRPEFWQTWWFRSAAGALMAAAVGLGVRADTRRRMRRKLERLERQRAIERERARIAKDIHDDLGAGLTRISLLSESFPSELVDPPQAADVLNRIFKTAHELMLAMDEIVWAVNPQHDTLDSLASYLGKFAQDFLETAHVRCRLDVPVQLPALPLSAEVRHNLFLAFKEALHNVLKHAAASEVRISLLLEPSMFVISVADNGRGFTAGTSKPDDANAVSANPSERNGLRNMRQRLAEIGGRCEIDSHPGNGTQVRFVVAIQPSGS
jgi:signal transduction histidine kinase